MQPCENLDRCNHRMKKKRLSKGTGERQPYKLHLPGFTGKEVGLGDAIKHTTSAVGIRPCTGCERRAAALNRLLVFTGGHSN
jgi:hypothetical protein